MSRTITISLYSTVKSALFSKESMSVRYPLVRNWSDCSTLRGGSRKPSRWGSSPSSVSKFRMICCILAFYPLALTSGDLHALPGNASTNMRGLARGQAQEQAADPDELYRHREDIANAR